ncbi:MAG: MFS transporter [Nocardioidaceae bacterium]
MRIPAEARALFAASGFRKLLATRLVSQFGDGLFQAGLASLVLLSPDNQRSPGQVATAAAVVLLPFSCIGPLTGLWLDRWSRRQVLWRGQLIRVALVVLLLLGGHQHASIGGYVLAVGALAVNRFLLAAMSAGMPHVVSRPLLVAANSTAPTAGTIAILLGAGTGGALLGTLGGSGSAAPLGAAAVAYLLAGGLALRMSRDELGPDGAPTLTPGAVMSGLAAGVSHLRTRADARAALLTIGGFRLGYGLWTVQAFMLSVHTLSSGLRVLTIVATASGAGFLSAAVLAPLALRRTTRQRWSLGLLVVATLAVATLTQPAAMTTLSMAGFALGLAGQGIKIGVDVTVQSSVSDGHLGWVYAIYDVVYNASFVAAAVLAVLIVPVSGRSDAAIVASCVVFGATGAALVVSGWRRASVQR